MPLKNIITLTNLTLLVALALSSVAAYYSIIGLTAIFAGAVIPVIVMGSILEVGKITTTVWLRKYWNQCSWVLKLYLVPAVVALAFLTSMGIFGFLSKAHTDQNMVSGDALAKLAIYDEKIKTAKENIDANRRALKQMDEAVDQVMGRSTTETGAERSVQIRRQQGPERKRLISEIEAEQKKISSLNEERAPIASEVRKVEAEVGPIKYIAAFIYGDNPDTNLLERAVRWVIILLVIVFDPLAIALVLAANSSKEWDKKVNDDVASISINPEPEGITTKPFDEKEEQKALDEPIETPMSTERHDSDTKKVEDDLLPTDEEIAPKDEPEQPRPHHPDTHPYLTKGFKYPEGWQHNKPLVYKPEVEEEPVTDDQVKNIEKKLSILTAIHKEPEPVEPTVEPKVDTIEIVTEGVTKEFPYEELADGWVKHDGKTLQKDALKRLKPELFAVPDNVNQIKTGFGTSFPQIANRGDVFVRVDTLPNRVFKFDGNKWVELNKNNTTSYLDDKNYIQFLINKVYTGEYDLDSMTEDERAQIEEFLKNQNS